MRGDHSCQPFVWQPLCRAASHGFDIRRIGLVVAADDQRPEFDPPRLILAAGHVPDRPGLTDTARRVGLAEHPVDGIEHGRCRAERDVEADRHEHPVGDAAALVEPEAHLLELARIGALEAEDRLLGVADGEDGAAAADRAFAHEELLGEAADHFPLVGIGVLRLVDQHVIDAAVELEQYPRGAFRCLQQAARRHDQIVVVEHGAAALGARVAVGDVEAQPQQGQGQFDEGLPAGAFESRGLDLEDFDDAGQALLRRLGCQRLAHLSFVGEEHASIGGAEIVEPVVQPGSDPLAVRSIGLAAGFDQGPRRFTQRGFVERCRALAVQLSAQSRPQFRETALVDDTGEQPRPLAQQPRHQLGVLGDRDLGGDEGQGGRERRRRVATRQGFHLLVLNAAQDRLRLGLVEDIEARCDARFEREAFQQRLAEGMDGQDVDAARRIEHTREEAACHDALRRIGCPVDQLGDAGVERRLVGQRPAAELVGEAVAHFGGCRLGEGEAEDALGFDAFEQQPRHAVGEDLRLARAGIGHDPGGMIGRGGAPLRIGRQGDGVEHVAHSSPPPAVDHSAIRSRWA